MNETTKAENLRPGWKPGQSGNPKGRPRGSRNRVTLVALAAMEEGADAIARKVVDMAKEGDMSAARLVLERLVPPAKERPIFLELPEHETAEGIARLRTSHPASGGGRRPSARRGRDSGRHRRSAPQGR
ncbi:MAG: DUF5681 domain-containing protein [Candidatus Accumulibacter necessarius]|uniref:DUF5681 domain-containing protein n=1 Tax=Candidatus Accumulibacter necessarius TaxID=2954386 RepID=UPI002FC37C1C